MPNDTKNCPTCPFNKYNTCALKSKNIKYIWSKKNKGPLVLENNRSQILLVFEAPGIDEWSKRQPIISNRVYSAGRKFNEALKRAGKARTNYDITEAVLCFPGKSSTGKNQKIQTEVKSAAKYCITFLINDIVTHNYGKIICFGNVAYESVCTACRIIQSKHLQYATPQIIRLQHPMYSKTLQQDIAENL